MWKTWGEAEVVRKVQSPILPPFREKAHLRLGILLFVSILSLFIERKQVIRTPLLPQNNTKQQ